MNCSDVRRHWNLYFDSEGDREPLFQIGEHLAICPSCAEWYSKQNRLEGLIADKLTSAEATPSIWSRALEQVAPAAVPRKGSWFLFSSLAATVACIALIAWSVVQWRDNGETIRSTESAADLAKLTSQWHQRLAAGQQTLEFASQSDEEIERYLRRRLTFPVRCPPRKDAGFEVKGAGVCQFANHPAAYLSGQVESARVSVFVLPKESLAAFPHQQEALRKEKTHRCREGALEMVLGVIDRNAVLVIGDASADRLERVLGAYGSYPDHP